MESNLIEVKIGTKKEKLVFIPSYFILNTKKVDPLTNHNLSENQKIDNSGSTLLYRNTPFIRLKGQNLDIL